MNTSMPIYADLSQHGTDKQYVSFTFNAVLYIAPLCAARAEAVVRLDLFHNAFPHRAEAHI